MKKKTLLRRIEALESCLGRFLEREEAMTTRISDLEEIVFECDLMESSPVNQPDRRSN